MQQVVLAAAPKANVPDLRERASTWAKAHPVQSNLTGRASVDPLLIRKVGETDLGTVASIKALGESLGDLTARLDSYNLYLPKQARWQAELLLTDVTRDPEIKATLTNFSTFSGTLAKTSNAMDRVPQYMTQARAAMNSDVEGQRLAAQEFISRERVEFLNGIQRERVAVIASMRGERVAATSDLHNETENVLDALHKERVDALSDFNNVSEKAVKDFDEKGRSLIDHFFLRAFELVLITLALCFLVAWLLLRRFVPKRPERDQRLYDRAA
jgi:hypothetical protein